MWRVALLCVTVLQCYNVTVLERGRRALQVTLPKLNDAQRRDRNRATVK